MQTQYRRLPAVFISRRTLTIGLTLCLTLSLTLCPSMVFACSPFIEEHTSWSSASLRPHATAFERCEIDEQSYHRIVSEWLRDRPTGSANLSSLSLGRVVIYPWLSRYIADSALGRPDWAARISKAKPIDREKLAAAVLLDPALLRRLSIPFEGTPYRVLSVSFEKMLFGRADEFSSNGKAGAVMVPFDAQLWLRLAPRN